MRIEILEIIEALEKNDIHFLEKCIQSENNLTEDEGTFLLDFILDSDLYGLIVDHLIDWIRHQDENHEYYQYYEDYEYYDD